MGLNLLDTGKTANIELLMLAIQEGVTDDALDKEVRNKIQELEQKTPSLWFPNGIEKRMVHKKAFTSEETPLQGKVFPIETFTPLVGAESSLEQITAKVYVVDIWATWCGPCIAELPNVKKTYAKYHEKGFEIVFITYGDSFDYSFTNDLDGIKIVPYYSKTTKPKLKLFSFL